MKIVINKSHLGGNFRNTANCPLAKAIMEQLEVPSARVGTHTIFITTNQEEIGYIEPGFEEEDFDRLVSGEINEFVTEYTPINN